MPDNTHFPGGVFLSYAREDTDAARRIAEAMRAFGIDAWFDQGELRGGEAWDATIKKRIRECAMFMPVISAGTQARSEGYFRREWKLAVERTHDMAAGRAFLVPVVIDATAESEALVPEEFMRVQWTRLPGGVLPAEFAGHVKRLLEAPRKPSLAAAPKPPMTTLPPFKQPAAGTKSASRLPLVLGVVAALLVAAGAAFFALRPPAPVASPPVPVGAETKPVPVTALKLEDKSIAVLPFTNMSEDKDSGYFADGIHEDILTNLAHIATLRVVSRTSVMEYRGKTENIRAIAQKLGVAYILEGSVRRAGNKVRVTGQLIHAATDDHLWAQSYDRDLTDIFAIQAELSQEIAKALSAALSPQEKARLDHPTVVNPAAYDLLLRARQIDRNGNDTRQELETEEAMLQSAVALDPSYAAAWAGLSVVHSQMIFNALDTSEARLAKARATIDTARRLDPDNPDVIVGNGTLYYYGLRDYPHALEQFGQLTRLWPNNYIGHFLTGLVLRRQGKWVESLASLRRAAELDPGSAELARNLMISFIAMRRYPEAIAQQERRVRLLPESLRESFEVVRLKFLQNGSTREGDELLAGPIAGRADPAVAAGYRKLWAALKGDLAAVQALNRDYPEAWAPGLGSGGGSPAEYAANNAVVLAVQGDVAGARQRVEKFPAELRARLVNEPRNATVLILLAQIEALLGHNEAALAAAQQARTIMPYSLDALSARGPHLTLAFVLAWNGDQAGAVAEVRQLLAAGGQQSVPWFKNYPWFAPLKGNAAFEALLADPKSNEPLF